MTNNKLIGTVIVISHKQLIALNDSIKYTVKITTNFPTKIYIGDEVSFQLKNEEYGINSVIPRKNLVFRPKIANIESIIIVYPLDQKHSIYYDLFGGIMQYEYQYLNVMVLFTKGDIISIEQQKNLELNITFLNHLKIPHYNYRTNNNFMSFFVANHIYALVGLSGAGKSTFINFLDPGYALATQEINFKNKYGKHTTTTTKIYKVNNGYLIDTPGFSNILNIKTPQDCAGAGKQGKQYQLKHCAFKNCIHNEKSHNCYIRSLINIKFQPEFYEMYLHLLNRINK